MPQRIQQRRTKGWRKPEGAVAVGRGTKWGNPYAVEEWGLDRALLLFRDLCHGSWSPSHVDSEDAATHSRAYELGSAFLRRLREHPLEAMRAELAGKDLMCWCPLPEPGQPDHCHAAVLLELANPPSEEA